MKLLVSMESLNFVDYIADLIDKNVTSPSGHSTEK